jgi:hypothetical protein
MNKYNLIQKYHNYKKDKKIKKKQNNIIIINTRLKLLKIY